MGSDADIFAKLAGHFPGDADNILPSLVGGLSADGTLSQPDAALLSKLPEPKPFAQTPASQPSAPAAKAPTAKLPPAPTPVAKPPTAPLPQPKAAPKPPTAIIPAAAKAPAPPAAPQPVAVSRRNDPAVSTESVDNALSEVLAQNAESGLFSAPDNISSVATTISRRLPAAAAQTDDLEDDIVIEDEEDIPAEVMSGNAKDEAEAALNAPSGGADDEEKPTATISLGSDFDAPAESSQAAPSSGDSFLDAAIDDALADAASPPASTPAAQAGLAKPSSTDLDLDSLIADVVGPSPKSAQAPIAAAASAPAVGSDLDSLIAGIEQKVTADTSAPAASADGLDLDSLMSDVLGTSDAGPPPAPIAAEEARAATDTGEKAADLWQIERPEDEVRPTLTKSYTRAQELSDEQLMNAADELLEDIASELHLKGEALPSDLLKKVDATRMLAKPSTRTVAAARAAIDGGAGASAAPAANGTAAVPTNRVQVTAQPAGATASVQGASSPPPARTAMVKPGTQSLSDLAAAAMSKAPSGKAGDRPTAKAKTAEDVLAGHITTTIDIAEQHTMVLSRDAVNRAGKKRVGVGDLARYKVVLGALGFAFFVSGIAVYTWFHLFTGKF